MPVSSIWRGQWRSLTVGVIAVISVLAFEAMAVATAMPVAVRDLHGVAFYAWGFSAYLVASLVGMVLAGELCDRRGPVQPFLFALGIFVVGLVLAGTAQSMALFVAARAVQGVGSGMDVVALYVVVGRLYPEEMRPRLFAAMSGAWVVPALVGPTIAGLLTDHLSWRWVFLIVPPLVVPALVLMLPRLHGLGPAAEDQHVPRRTAPALAVAVGVGLLQYAGQRLDAWSLPLLVAGLVLLRLSLPRLLPRGTLRLRRGLPMAVLMRGVMAGAFFGAESFVPLMLVERRGLSVGLAGLTLTTAAVTWSIGSWLQGRPGMNVPRHVLIRIGSLLVAAGVLGVAVALWPAVPVVLASAGWALAGLGMGLGMTSTNVLLLALSPKAEQGFNSAALQLSDALGSVLLIGVGGALFAGLHGSGERASSTAFLAITIAMAVVAATGALIAGRAADPRRMTPSGADVGGDTR